MPCEKVDHLGPSGPVGIIICKGRRPRLRCKYCGNYSDVLCDAVLGTGPRKGKTCDAPMCAKCTFRPAVNTDYCRDHRPAEKEAINATP